MTEKHVGGKRARWWRLSSSTQDHVTGSFMLLGAPSNADETHGRASSRRRELQTKLQRQTDRGMIRRLNYFCCCFKYKEG